MRIIAIVGLFLWSLNLCGQDYQPVEVPRKISIDTFHNKYIIEDPYQWLEKTDAPQTIEWLEAQKKLTKRYLRRVASRDFVDIDKYAYTRYKLPRKEGQFYFLYAYNDNISSPSLFYKKRLNDYWEVLVNPNYISVKDKTSLKSWEISGDSKYLAFQFDRNGSDWGEVKVINTRTESYLSDHLTGLKFSNIAWRGKGFYYSTMEQVGKFGVTQGQKVYYHNLGANQEDDQLIFLNKRNPQAEFTYGTTSNERFFYIKQENPENGRINLYYIDFESGINQLRPLLTNINFEFSVLDSHNGKFIMSTHRNKSNGMIVKVDPVNPMKWEAIAPSYDEALLTGSLTFANQIIAFYQTKFAPLITIYDYDGKVLHTKQLPAATSIDGFSAEYEAKELYYSWQSYTIPDIVYNLDLETYKEELNKKTSVSFDFENIKYETIEYEADDGVKVPMVLVYKKDLEKNGDNPVVLKTYGGYGNIPSPSFNPGIVHLISEGGIFAYAHVRGGGMKGVEWSLAGKRRKKQRTISDLINAAEFLVDHNYTSSDRIGILGSSHGGLIVVAAALQRPDLFDAVVSIAGPHDMIRKEKFTVGVINNEEYGTVQDSLDFLSILAYSPYHNIKKNTNYPAMLIKTGDNDDRVPPLHSYKFVARLQNRKAQKNPVLLKIEEQAGHYGSRTLRGNIRELAETYGFFLKELKD